jgi:hypothetical protein
MGSIVCFRVVSISVLPEGILLFHPSLSYGSCLPNGRQCPSEEWEDGFGAFAIPWSILK